MKRWVALASAFAASSYVVHRLGHRSGAKNREIEDELPGDELVLEPAWQSTRAITIDAPPERVWPWIVQMGFPSHRAGWYTPDWLDRLTFGIKQSSADQIRPDLQHLARGDRVPDSHDWSVFFTVAAVDPPQTLVLHSTRHVIGPIKTIDFSWAFVLQVLPGGKTRLFIRARANYTPPSAAWFVELVIGPGDFVNAGAMLRGIKRRVERAEHPMPAKPPTRARQEVQVR
jgi:hypothetical protein